MLMNLINIDMKWLLAVLLIFLIALQYRLWRGEGSFSQAAKLEHSILQQQAENDRMRERNRILEVEVDDLKAGADSVEERARNDIGMIKKDETFFMIPAKNNKAEQK
jgi:cell division protein FtsB